MAHPIEEIEQLILSYEQLANQKLYLRAALDYPGEPITVAPQPGVVITFIPVYNMDWLRDAIESLSLSIDARRQAIRTDLES